MDDCELPADFPVQESFDDCAGSQRHFALECAKVPTGWLVTATELPNSQVGYRFESFSPVNPYLALGELRAKVRRGLATRYLKIGSVPEFSHDVARGRIDWNAASESIQLVIDGRPVTLSDLERILQTYEGWQIELRIREPGD